jgi:integrase
MSLKDIQIKALKAREKIYRIADGDGLAIEVRTNGAKFWRYRYRFAGKAGMLSIGEYPMVSLLVARKMRDDARELLAQGIDPNDKRKQDKADIIEQCIEAEEIAFTIADAFNEWCKVKIDNWTTKHALDVESRFNAYLAPHLAHKPLTDITPADCITALKVIEALGKLSTLAKTKVLLGQIMRYSVSTGKLSSDPSRDISNDIFAKQIQRNYAHQTDPQIIKGVYQTICQPYRGYQTVRNAIKLLALTFLRANELAGLKWSEVDLGNKRLRISPDRMKMKREHIVPLSRQAVAIIEEQQAFLMGSEFVFSSWLNQDSPITTQSILAGMRRQGVDKDTFTSHGWRHAASTTLHELGFSPQAIEAQLAHIVSGVAGVYNKALHLDERTKMMQAWADFLESQ